MKMLSSAKLKAVHAQVKEKWFMNDILDQIPKNAMTVNPACAKGVKGGKCLESREEPCYWE